jgi:hypothetical protein
MATTAAANKAKPSMMRRSFIVVASLHVLDATTNFVKHK